MHIDSVIFKNLHLTRGTTCTFLLMMIDHLFTVTRFEQNLQGTLKNSFTISLHRLYIRRFFRGYTVHLSFRCSINTPKRHSTVHTFRKSRESDSVTSITNRSMHQWQTNFTWRISQWMYILLNCMSFPRDVYLYTLYYENESRFYDSFILCDLMEFLL